ncbi:hypothetical protein [Massilia sp. YMA4]|uniref:hypothetical protein n=1 Tax=Massilia sp. YMA4 TaxID=1593482 RepID=UPI001583141B|nr:hypothetical protein [Massilia sp. YMA4]
MRLIFTTLSDSRQPAMFPKPPRPVPPPRALVTQVVQQQVTQRQDPRVLVVPLPPPAPAPPDDPAR